MPVLNVRKWVNPVLAVVCVCLLALLVNQVISYVQQNRLARVDRSNAMQVIKPIAADQTAATAVYDFFTDYRLERDRLRSERAEVLREAMRSTPGEEARQKGQDAMLKLIVDKERETEMENLIKAKGFADALVLVRGNSVSVIIKTQALSREDVVQVADIISRVSGARPEDITISAKL